MPKALAEHVLNQIGNSQITRNSKRSFIQALTELQSSSEIEILATDDRVCSKAFNSALTLPTATAMSVFTTGLFRNIMPHDEVYISCETGEWLLEDEVMFELLSKQDRVEVITAFDFKYGDLDTKYQGKLVHHFIGPWRHNRHMTIVCRRQSPWRAVYFARRLRTPLITPVYLKDPEDAARLKRAFDLMRHEIEAASPAADRRAEPD